MAATEKSTNQPKSRLTVVRDAICTACGCLCDDIDLTVQENQIVEAKRACELAQPWFLDSKNADRPICSIEGKLASLSEGIERAAQILASAKAPLVYGLGDTTSEAQRIAVQIADWISGTVDSSTSTNRGSSGTTFQGVGEVTCSLGEIANRGDLLLFWGANPAKSHPRHFSRYSLMPKGRFVPRGRQDRTCVVIDVSKTATADEADLLIQVKPNSDFEAIWVLRAIARGEQLIADEVEQQTGVALSVWQDLMARMKGARYGVIVYGTGLTKTRGRHINADAVQALVRDMNAYTRFVASPLGGPGNTAGADNVLCWQTGYPFGVSLSRGYPRFNPGEYTANDLLARGEADAAMIVASDPRLHLDKPAYERLTSIPSIVLDYRDTQTMRGATVAFTTAIYGINIPGTVYRMDDVPLRLRPAVNSTLPSDVDILGRIEKRVRELKAASG